MAGALITLFRWSLFKYASAVLICVWAFNPLGSQAALRLANLKDVAGKKEGLVTFVNPDLTKLPKRIMFDPTMSRGTDAPTIKAIYSAALYDIVSRIQNVDNGTSEYAGLISALGGVEAASAQAAMDIWGNLRIPSLEYLDDHDTQNPHMWHDVPQTNSVPVYASLIGDLFQGIERGMNGTTSFNLTSSYQKFNVSPTVPVFDNILILVT
jgi:hypothetical protein